MFTPEPLECGFPRMFIAAVGEAMTEMCGEVGRRSARPRLHHEALRRRGHHARARGGHRSGRAGSRADVRGVVPGVHRHRRHRGGHGRRPPSACASRSPSTGRRPPTARCSTCTAGATCTPSCTGCRSKGGGTPWASSIDDDVLGAFAVVAPLPTLATALRERCDGAIDRVLPAFPAGLDEDAVTAVLDEVRAHG